jgi:hypothetical protein
VEPTLFSHSSFISQWLKIGEQILFFMDEGRSGVRYADWKPAGNADKCQIYWSGMK